MAAGSARERIIRETRECPDQRRASVDLAYHESNRAAGRYIGEIRMSFEFQAWKGPFCRWLHADPETLKEHAAWTGWKCEVICRESSGTCLASLTRT